MHLPHGLFEAESTALTDVLACSSRGLSLPGAGNEAQVLVGSEAQPRSCSFPECKTRTQGRPEAALSITSGRVMASGDSRRGSWRGLAVCVCGEGAKTDFLLVP